MEYLDPIDSFENVKINYREVTGKTSSLSQNLDVRIKKKKHVATGEAQNV